MHFISHMNTFQPQNTCPRRPSYLMVADHITSFNIVQWCKNIVKKSPR